MPLFRNFNPRKQIHLVISQMNSGDMKKAQQTCEGLLRKAPRNAEAAKLMAQIYERLGNERKALSFYRKAAEVNPNYPNLRSYGTLCRKLGELGEATQAFEKAHQLQPDSAEITGKLAEIFEDRAMWPRAVGLRKCVVDSHPGDMDALFLLCRCTYRAGLMEEAVILLTRLLNKASDHVDGLRLLADCMLRRKLHERALELYLRALEGRPEDWEGHYNLAKVYLSLNQTDQAIEHFQLCLRFNSRHEDSHRQLIEISKEKEQWLEAEIVLKHLVTTSGDSPELMEEIGDVAMKQSEYEAATTAYQQARILGKQQEEMDAKYVCAAVHAGRAAEVLSLAQRLSSNNTFHLHYHYLYALCLIGVDERQSAVNVVKELTVSPEQHPELFKLRGRLLDGTPPSPASQASA